jgi:hypothetical protein
MYRVAFKNAKPLKMSLVIAALSATVLVLGLQRSSRRLSG